MPRRTSEVLHEVTESADVERTPVKPKAETRRVAEPQAEVLREAQERVTAYATGSVVERLGTGGSTEKWTVDSIDARGTVFLTNENGKRAMMHETELVLEERAATFAPQLDAAWGKTVDTVADMTDDDDLHETAAFLKSHRGDILLIAAERLAAKPDADPARALLGAIHETQRRITAEQELAEDDRREREEIAEAKRYVGITPNDAVRLADADNMLGHLRFGSHFHEGFDPGIPANKHDITTPHLENVANARATVAELAVLEPNLRDEILGNIPDVIDNGRSFADINAELKKVNDDLNFTETQWQARGNDLHDDTQALVYFTVTRSLRERQMHLATELHGVTEQKVARGEEVTLTLPPRRRTAPRARAAEIKKYKPDTYRAPKKIEPFRKHDRPTTPTRQNRGMSEDEWMAEGDQGENLPAFEVAANANPEWYRKFTEDFGGSQDFQRMHAEAKARTSAVKFTLEDLKHSNFVTRYFYRRQMDKAVKEMVAQDAKKARRGKLQA